MFVTSLFGIIATMRTHMCVGSMMASKHRAGLEVFVVSHSQRTELLTVHIFREKAKGTLQQLG
jgi:hypothetical protein